MIKIIFNKLSYLLQPHESIHEGKPVVSKYHETKIDDTWNGETFRVQSIFMPQHEIKMYMRETEWLSFQQIQYSPDVTILWNGEIFKSKDVYISLTSSDIVNEVREVTLTFADIEQKKIENTILENDVKNVLKFFYDTPPAIEWNLYLDEISKNKFEKNEISNFKNKINDYKKLSKTVSLRLYLSSSQLEIFTEEMLLVVPGSGRFIFDAINYYQFDYSSELIGHDLYKIDLILYETNPIISKQW